MKKRIGLFVALLFSMGIYAQKVEFSDFKEGFDKENTLYFNFVFDSSFTQESLKEAATLYTSYFSAEVIKSNESYMVKILLNKESEMGRRVMKRYFIGLGVNIIFAGGMEHNTNDFMIKFVQL